MADKENLIENCKEFFSNTSNWTFESYDGSTLVLSILSDENQAKTILKSIFTDVKDLPAKKVEIRLSSVGDSDLQVYYNEEDFINNYEKYAEDFDSKTIFLISSQHGSLIKQVNENYLAEKSLLFNYPIYRALHSYLIGKNEFTPYHDDLNHQFVIISKETGPFYIGYDLSESRLQDLEDLKPSFFALKEQFEKKEFIQFFKNVVIAGTHRTDAKDRFFELTKTLKVLLNLTERDYDNYILDFAFDKIKTKFKEERNKYFDSLEKGIDSVSKQVVSFPLTFAATAFASYQVKDKPVILGLIILAYLLYTIIANKILQFVRYSVDCLVEDVDREENEIKNSYNKLYDDFKTDFQKIRNKILKLNTILNWLKIILWGLLVLFVLYSGYQMVSISSASNSNEQVVKIPTSNIKMTVEQKIYPEKDSINKIKSSMVEIRTNDTAQNIKNLKLNGDLNKKADKSRIGKILPEKN